MKNDLTDTTDNRIDMLIDVMRRNEHFITSSSNEEKGKKKYGFNSHVVISESIDFLEAIRREIGGEILSSKSIGPFLYFE